MTDSTQSKYTYYAFISSKHEGMTDVATSEQLFRIIQSIPSPKAEPFKQWIARVAATRIDQLKLGTVTKNEEKNGKEVLR